MNDHSMTVLPRQVKDIRGMVFGRLTVAEYAGIAKCRQAQWRCQCSCGNEVVVRGTGLRDGCTQSCGCLRKERVREALAVMVNGAPITKHPLCKTWYAMIKRCTNPKAKEYGRYGARGIHVCHRWQLPNGEGFANFVSDMGPKPSPSHSIERICNEDGYTKHNCTWALVGSQNRNRRSNVWFMYGNAKMILTDLAALLGIKRGTLNQRFRRLKAANKTPRTFDGAYIATDELIAKVA